MATWAEVTEEMPGLAELAAQLWPGMVALGAGEAPPDPHDVFRIAYLATVRPDGGPRLHPFCPVIADGRLVAVIPQRSPKGHDLRRNPRCVVHAMPGPADDELCIRARAVELPTDGAPAVAVREAVGRSGVGGMIETARRDPMFELDIERVDTARWENVGQPGTYARRSRWPTADEPPR